MLRLTARRFNELAGASAGFAHRSIYAQVVQPNRLCLGGRIGRGATEFDKCKEFSLIDF